MPEITERTKIGMQLGGALAVIVAVFCFGRYAGSFETERVTTAATLARHESALTELHASIQKIDSALVEIHGEQTTSREMISNTNKNVNAMVYEWGDLKVALAQRGINLGRPTESK